MARLLRITQNTLESVMKPPKLIDSLNPKWFSPVFASLYLLLKFSRLYFTLLYVFSFFGSFVLSLFCLLLLCFFWSTFTMIFSKCDIALELSFGVSSSDLYSLLLLYHIFWVPQWVSIRFVYYLLRNPKLPLKPIQMAIEYDYGLLPPTIKLTLSHL